jgi:hypothetical protein
MSTNRLGCQPSLRKISAVAGVRLYAMETHSGINMEFGVVSGVNLVAATTDSGGGSGR